MGYTKVDYDKRMRYRSDLSSYVTHLTRKSDVGNAREVAIKILREQKIVGSTNKGFVCGSDSAVCFQDAPIYSVCQNSYHEQMYTDELGGKKRYDPIGLSFKKDFVYKSGGRPVIYEKKDVAKSFINEEEWWRIVSFDLSDPKNIVDWTHEREWRCKGDFTFELEDVTVLLTSHTTYKNFVNEVDHNTLSRLGGIIVLNPILT